MESVPGKTPEKASAPGKRRMSSQIRAKHNGSRILQEDFEELATLDLPWEQLEGAAILVAGATGYIARYLALFLLHLNDSKLSRPCRILALARNSEKAAAHFGQYVGRDDFQLLVQDVSDPVPYKGPVDYIVQAASQSRPRHFNPDPEATIRPNVAGTLNLLEFSKRSQCRAFLLLSSGEVYGHFDAVPGKPVDETCFGWLDPLEVRSCYAESKRMAETLCAAWHRQHGVPARIVRMGHTYGPGMDLDDGRVFADFTSSIVHGRNITLKSDGSDMRQFCYLADTAAGLLAVLLKGRSGEAYNLVNVEAEITIKGLAELLCGLFPERGLKVVCPVASHKGAGAPWNPGVRVCVDKIRQLGWKPRVGLEKGFLRTVASYGVSPGA